MPKTRANANMLRLSWGQHSSYTLMSQPADIPGHHWTFAIPDKYTRYHNQRYHAAWHAPCGSLEYQIGKRGMLLDLIQDHPSSPQQWKKWCRGSQRSQNPGIAISTLAERNALGSGSRPPQQSLLRTPQRCGREYEPGHENGAAPFLAISCFCYSRMIHLDTNLILFTEDSNKTFKEICTFEVFLSVVFNWIKRPKKIIARCPIEMHFNLFVHILT